MSDFLTAVKSVRNRKEDEVQDPFLTAVKSTSSKTKDASRNIQQHETGNDQPETVKTTRIKKVPNSPQEALQNLRSQPDQTQLLATLSQLSSVDAFKLEHFNISAPGPLQAQMINTILNTIVPDFWQNLQAKEYGSLLTCLRSVAGFNAMVARLRFLSSQKQQRDVPGNSSSGAELQDLLEVASRLFAGDKAVLKVWEGLQDALVDDGVKREMSWKEFVNLVGSGKVISTVAQAEDALMDGRDGNHTKKATWLGKGAEYAAWLGRNAAMMISSRSKDGDEAHHTSRATGQILTKALNLGYPAPLLKGLFTPLVQHEIGRSEFEGSVIGVLLNVLPSHSKRSLAEHTLRWLSDLTTGEGHQQGKGVSAIAALLSYMITSDETIKQHIISFITDPALSTSLSFPTRRACIAALSNANNDELHELLERTISTFSAPLFISHSPILQQESLAQTLLLAAGYVHREAPMALLVAARSSNQMQGVSNRLDSSNTRARWLGMVVGTALSSLVDKEGARMNFGTEEMRSEDAKSWLELVKVEDTVGTLQEFAALLDAQDKRLMTPRRMKNKQEREQLPKINGKQVYGPPRPPTPVQTEVIGEKVEEVLDGDSNDEEDDLRPYAKPDSDPEDSDEDATLVNRNKARKPVYIRDLMSMLRDDKDHDRFQLGIKHAAALIRRKSNFGTEVKDHTEELATILCPLQDPFATEDFDESKLQALIAVLLSDVKVIAPWMSRQAFVGEYSISQRCVMLSAIGLGGRELGGLKSEDEALNPTQTNTAFPSKRLPPHLHSIYSATTAAGSTKRLDAATKDMERALIKPLALDAADKSTAHLNAVKVRTFSSRMDVERTRRKPAPNQLAKVFGEALFFPLVNRYQQEVAAYGSASVYASVPFVLVTFLKTVALLLHASGPATVGLPEISSEFWDLLLSLRVQAISDISISQAVLFSLLTVLEVNADKRRIAQEHPKQLMETQQWVDMVFERMGGGGFVSEGGNEEEAKVRTLAAGVLVKAREVVEAYQKELVGYSLD